MTSPVAALTDQLASHGTIATPQTSAQHAVSPQASMAGQPPVFALWFSEDNLNFSLSELLAVCEYWGIEPEVVSWQSSYPDLAATVEAFRQARHVYCHGTQAPGAYHEPPPEWRSPFVLVRFPGGEADVRRVVSRSVGIKLAVEVWAHADDSEVLHQQARSSEAAELIAPWKAKGGTLTWRIHCINYGWTVSDQDRLAQINTLSYLALPGKIRLKKAELVISLVSIFDYHHHLTQPKIERGDKSNPPAKVPVHYYLGRQLDDMPYGRRLIESMAVSKRLYYGNTTMEASMSLRMALMAMAGPGKLVYDPFMGTGSMLHTAAKFGAYVYGSELDGRQIRGKERTCDSSVADRQLTDMHNAAAAMGSRTTSVMNTARKYGTASQMLDCVHMDVTQPAWRHSAWASHGLFDAIVTDPPYGVRAGAKKLGARPGSRQERTGKVPFQLPTGEFAHELPDYKPPTRAYHLSDLLIDLLAQSALLLADGGRLVFFVPSVTDPNAEDKVQTPVPTHPDLELVAVNTQDFGYWGRILITMRRRPRSETKQTEQARFQRSEAGFVSADQDKFEFRNQYFIRPSTAKPT